MTLIYKIAPGALWREAEAAGVFVGSPVDLKDGFIHFSDAAQVRETAARYFAGEADLVLAAIDASKLGRSAPLGGIARRRALPASLRAARDGGGRMGEAAAGWSGRGAHLPGYRLMFDRLYELARRPIFAIEPELAHRLAIGVLHTPLARLGAPANDDRLKRSLLGLDFPNPIGMAGGFDKNGEAIDGLLALGFGFVETGTVTPLPQPGNPKPRLFRLAGDAALINSLGFNSGGFDVLHRRLLARRGKPGLVGVNLGANRDSADRTADYVAGIAAFADVADYFAINISSPNTVGLRDLQAAAALRDLLAAVKAARDAAPRRVPLLVKLAPDLSDGELAGVAETVVEAGIDGVIVSNTTTSRPALADKRHASEKGGLSGKPLFRLSTVKLARFRQMVGKEMVLIGVGGVDSGETAWAKFAAGADLVQLYTGFIYRGPGLAASINRYLLKRLAREGVKSIADIVGTRASQWADEEV